MADSGTLATTAQVLLAIGKDANADQILEANTNFWILMAESEMEKTFGKKIGIVANYATLTAANKQWLAMVASHRAAFYAINQDQNAWQLATAQSKLNVCDSIWRGFMGDMKNNRASIIADLNL